MASKAIERTLIITLVVMVVIAAGVLAAFFSRSLKTQVVNVTITESIIGGKIKPELIHSGTHELVFRAKTKTGGVVADTVTFKTQSPL